MILVQTGDGADVGITVGGDVSGPFSWTNFSSRRSVTVGADGDAVVGINVSAAVSTTVCDSVGNDVGATVGEYYSSIGD